ncbi:enoyl-CoA hydratase/isomerase family protein [Maricaulis sp.]|uniref:enoyl-CoA hydratase/isomerase family protein n=1 Tax=Maricaulis sp. TaxID=1486257 RepID=UPI002B26A8C5|nr:enoyl-CoA hydratase/isomerase family protein [Maricaulis sp.]
MNSDATPSPVLVRRDDEVVRITLNRPGHGNALEPVLLNALCDALGDSRNARTVILTGAGRAFSSGGDIREFQARADDPASLEAFGDTVVSALNRAILALRALPCPTIAAVNGPLTGGAIGLMLACDITLMSRDAFIQPYYARMGFAPDGGWTALLPARIGAGRAGSWLAQDSRLDADAALAMGVVDRVCDARNFAGQLAELTQLQAAHDPQTALASRQLLDAGLGSPTLAERLELELASFKQLLIRPEARQRMEAFLAPREAAG